MTASDGERLRATEQRLFESLGVTATEHQVELGRLGSTARVLAVGDGPPVLFVHGTMTAGASWAQLAARLPGFRCLLLDRPGCGLSPLPAVATRGLRGQQELGDLLVADVLDGMGLDTAAVISNSLGGWYTLRSAAAVPERISAIVGMGFQGGATIAGVPLVMRLQMPARLTPRRARVNGAIVRRMLKMAGMRRAVESGAFGERSIEWMVAVLGCTDTLGNESRYGPRPATLRGPVDEVMHSPELLASIEAPVHLFWGTDDIFGGRPAAEELARRLPMATVQMVSGAEHAPWLDEPELAAEAVRHHLAT